MIPRYKLIVIVHIGQLNSQSILIGSRCLWDPKSDTFSSYVFRNASLSALASVYAVYFEWLKIRNLGLIFLSQEIGRIYVHESFTAQKFENETTLIFQTTGIFGLFHTLWRTGGGREGWHKKGSCSPKGRTKSWFCWIVFHGHGFLFNITFGTNYFNFSL